MRMKSISRSVMSGTYSCCGVEQLAHRDRDARLLAQQPEVVVVLGRERVLEEEQAVRLERLAQVDRLG